VWCQLNSDQALRLLNLKGHFRARDSTLVNWSVSVFVHELAWMWTDFLSEQRRATDVFETAAEQVEKDSLHDARVRLKISLQYFPWQRHFCTVA